MASASTITTLDGTVSPSTTFISAPVAMIVVVSLILGCVIVLFVSVCVPVSVVTVLSIENVTLVPLAAESIPVPPNNPSVSPSRSMSIVLDPSVMSRSCNVTVAST